MSAPNTEAASQTYNPGYVPAFDTAKGLGERSPPASAGRARPPNAIWRILGLDLSVF